MRSIGFTGSWEGMTWHQADVLRDFLNDQPAPCSTYFHHGDCMGADFEAAELAKYLGFVTVSHPPLVDAYRAFHESAKVLDPRDYLTRDRDIVDASQFLVACPKSVGSKSAPYIGDSGGTWYTTRYAILVGLPTLLIPQHRTA